MNRWIKVEEGKPPPEMPVLIIYIFYDGDEPAAIHYGIADYTPDWSDQGDWAFVTSRGDVETLRNVIAWTLLPPIQQEILDKYENTYADEMKMFKTAFILENNLKEGLDNFCDNCKLKKHEEN